MPEGSEFQSRQGQECTLLHIFQVCSEAHPASYTIINGSTMVKRPWREADHSYPSSAEVKKMWIYTSTPPYTFMAQCLVKHRDNFTFTLPTSWKLTGEWNYIYNILKLNTWCHVTSRSSWLKPRETAGVPRCGKTWMGLRSGLESI
jgi:hypothetical protein